MSVRVVLSPRQQSSVARGRFVSIEIDGRSVLVGRVDGGWRAYENVCRHRALRLDFGGVSPMSDDGRFLLCHHHGALYRPTDGVCMTGPCDDRGLVALNITEDSGGLSIAEPARPDPPGD